MLIQPSRVILQNFRSQRHAVQRKRNASRELRKRHVPPLRKKPVVFNRRHFSRRIVYLAVIGNDAVGIGGFKKIRQLFEGLRIHPVVSIHDFEIFSARSLRAAVDGRAVSAVFF